MIIKISQSPNWHLHIAPSVKTNRPFTIINNKEEQQICTFKRLQPASVVLLKPFFSDENNWEFIFFLPINC